MEDLLPSVEGVAAAIVDAYSADRRVYTFGNGGSAAGSLHFAGELVARFKRERRPPAAPALAAGPPAPPGLADQHKDDDGLLPPGGAVLRPRGIPDRLTTSG